MIRSAVLGLTLLAACKTEPASDEGEAPRNAASAEEAESARRETHEKAFSALVPVAVEAMKLADPVGAAQLGVAPLRPAPATLSDREALGGANDAAIREARDIDGSLLEPKQQIGLRTIRFVLDRVNDQLTRHLPARNDPTFIIADLNRVLDELDYVALHTDCNDCAAAIGALVPSLDASHRELTAASDAGLAAAIEDLDRLRVRIERFPSRTAEPAPFADPVEQVIAGIEAARAGFVSARERLADAPPYSWVDRPPPRGGAAPLSRLPDILGGRALTRRLEVEEGLAVPLPTLLNSTKANLSRYDTMYDELAGSAVAEDRPRRVDLARCESAWRLLSETTLAQPGFEDASIDCEAVVRHTAGELLDDADLLIRVVDHGVVEPVRRAFRRSQDLTVALATGRWAPRSQLGIRRVMVLGPTGNRVALGRAIDASRGELCQAAAALWLHGELGEPKVLEAWLAQACPHAPPAAWTKEALGHPRAALAGLGLASISAEPASMVGIDMFYWAPLGLVSILATPPGSAPPAPAPEDSPAGRIPVQVQLEELGE